MQKYTEEFLNRLLEECMLIRSDYVTVYLTEEEKPIIGEIMMELANNGYISGFCPQMDTFFRCDLTDKALDLCVFNNDVFL